MVCHLLTWLRLVGKDWRGRRLKGGRGGVQFEQVRFRCLLELALGLPAPGIRGEERPGGITLGVVTLWLAFKTRTLDEILP